VTSLRRLFLIALLPLLALAVACGSSDSKGSSGSSSGSASESPSPSASAADGSCTYPPDTAGQVARKVDPPPSKPITTKATKVTITTNRGAIPITLDGDKTPCAVNSFLSLAKQGYFDKTPCHRLVDQGIFVLQCGDPSGTGQRGPGYALKDELPKNDTRLTNCQDNNGAKICVYPPGSIAMAKQGDPSTGLPVPDTAGSQFFLVYDNTQLPEGYQIIGRMTASGLQTVKKVAKAGAKPADASGNTAPKLATTIISVK
jgi:peptidyl-prolyl cis-trans isomerase B (cyclophilin B)